MSEPPFTAVIKVGGSLSHGPALPDLCQAIAALAARHRILIVPGGGTFADAVRSATQRYSLSDDAAHWMAILGIDQYGYLLADLIPSAQIARDMATARAGAATGVAPILLPFNLLAQRDPLPHSWAVTSDSIAAWICREIGAFQLILLKDVDGLYTADPDRDPQAVLHSRISRVDSGRYGGVDTYLPEVLHGMTADVWVINGNHPERLVALLGGSAAPAPATQISD